MHHRNRAMEQAFLNVQVKPGAKLTRTHKQILRVAERREKFRQQRRTNKGR